ncbi:NARE ribosyltransferase, partial [Campylorhamphus procurvoides]|nr:NARE ribosyltransferase [Campylorhamphus procurvoides]
MNMALNSFNDPYRGCCRRMRKAVWALNRTEFVPDSDYTEAWAKATATWHSRPSLGSRLRMDVAIALLAYTTEEGLYMELNKATRRAGRSRQEYLHNFPFKVVHFLLTKALYDLQGDKTHPRCLSAFRGVEGISFSTEPGRIVRFGQFASCSLLRNVSEHYGNDSFFEVQTCHGAAIRDFSFYPEEEEVLIPPFETFDVTSVTRQSDSTYIQLHSHGVYSKYNCAWLRGDIPG